MSIDEKRPHRGLFSFYLSYIKLANHHAVVGALLAGDGLGGRERQFVREQDQLGHAASHVQRRSPAHEPGADRQDRRERADSDTDLKDAEVGIVPAGCFRRVSVRCVVVHGECAVVLIRIGERGHGRSRVGTAHAALGIVVEKQRADVAPARAVDVLSARCGNAIRCHRRRSSRSDGRGCSEGLPLQVLDGWHSIASVQHTRVDDPGLQSRVALGDVDPAGILRVLRDDEGASGPRKGQQSGRV